MNSAHVSRRISFAVCNRCVGLGCASSSRSDCAALTITLRQIGTRRVARNPIGSYRVASTPASFCKCVRDSLYAFTSTRAASMTCLWCGSDHRVLSAGLVDDIHVNYGLGDFERAPSAEEMIKVSNIMSVLCMSYHRCTSRRRRRRHGQTRP